MKTSDTTVKTVMVNLKARHEYYVLETLEVGIALLGTEVKSVRAGKVNLLDSYATVENGQLLLRNMHISPFEKGNVFNHDPIRERKLLAHKREIRKLSEKTNEKGLTLIPLHLYFVGPKLKIELGVCKGKKLYDKRQAVKSRDMKREMERHT